MYKNWLLGKPLSVKEIEVAKLIGECKANREIAFDLGIKEGSVKQYALSLYRKLGFRKRIEVAVWVQSLKP